MFDNKNRWFLSVLLGLLNLSNVYAATFALNTVDSTLWVSASTAIDFDGDGDIDIVTSGATLFWYENDGSQGFTQRTIGSTGTNARSGYPVDMDLDGDMDVVTVDYDTHTVTWFENDGTNLAFTANTVHTGCTNGMSVIAADLDSDGDIDIACASEGADYLYWYQNDGSQGFTARGISTTLAGAQSVYAVDIDGDGDIDLITASKDDNSINIFKNNGNGGDWVATTITTSATGVRSVHAADIDGDGDMDIVAALADTNAVDWYVYVYTICRMYQYILLCIHLSIFSPTHTRVYVYVGLKMMEVSHSQNTPSQPMPPLPAQFSLLTWMLTAILTFWLLPVVTTPSPG